MLTPAFELSQSELFLTIKIKTPFAKISDTEIYVDGSEFKFYSKPYYLRLTLPGELVEDGRESAKYHSDSGTFTLTFPKANPGEEFEGLDMLTKLLAPSGERSAKQPMIEVIDETITQDADTDQDEIEDFDWQMEQSPYIEEDKPLGLDTPTYGFANRRSGVFQRLQTELHDILDLPDADHMSKEQRRLLRLKHEEQHFSEEHYLYDLHENDMIAQLLQYTPHSAVEYQQIKAGHDAENVVTFTEEEKEVMRKLPRTEYVLDSISTKQVLLGLVDIMFAYCYNHRTTEGENTGESSWTIAKLSATLSWLETFTSLRDVLVTCYRRSLCYPLYRRWLLTEKVFKDVCKIFTLGKRKLLKCLLEVRDILMDTDSRYILNDLYIIDYCVWIQSARARQLESLSRNLRKMKISKGDVGFDLEILEHAALLAIEEEKMAGKIVEDIQSLNIDKESNCDVSASCGSLSIRTEQKDRDSEIQTSTDAGSEGSESSHDSSTSSTESTGSTSSSSKSGSDETGSSSDETGSSSDEAGSSSDESESSASDSGSIASDSGSSADESGSSSDESGSSSESTELDSDDSQSVSDSLTSTDITSSRTDTQHNKFSDMHPIKVEVIGGNPSQVKQEEQ